MSSTGRAMRTSSPPSGRATGDAYGDALPPARRRGVQPGPPADPVLRGADDLVAEAFAKVLDTLRSGGGPDLAFRAYLLTTLRNTLYDRIRRDRRLELSDDMSAGTVRVRVDDCRGSGEVSGRITAAGGRCAVSDCDDPGRDGVAPLYRAPRAGIHRLQRRDRWPLVPRSSPRTPGRRTPTPTARTAHHDGAALASGRSGRHHGQGRHRQGGSSTTGRTTGRERAPRACGMARRAGSRGEGRGKVGGRRHS